MSAPTVCHATREFRQDTGAPDRPVIRKVRETVADRARRHLDQHHHFHGRAHHFEITHVRGTLIVRGKVPSFYLKQVLQTTLKSLDGVERIMNEVNVVCSAGVSSISMTGGDTHRRPK